MSEHLKRARRALQEADTSNVATCQMRSTQSIAYSLLAIAEELCLPKVVLREATSTGVLADSAEALARKIEEL